MKRLIIGLMMLVLVMPAWAGEKIVLSTLDWEPYVGQSMKNNGYVADVIKEAFKISGIDVEFQFYQWTRTVGLAKSGQVDGYFPEDYAEEVKEFATFSDPIQGGPLGFFKLKSKDISYKTLEDLKGYKIGTVQGYVNTKDFDDAEFLTKDPAKDEITSFKKLLAGRIDLVVADKFVGMDLVKANMPDNVDLIEFMSPPLEEKDLFLCISKKSKNAEKFNLAFEKGLKQLKEDGTFDKILKSHGF